MSYSISLFKKTKHQRGHFIGWVNISHKSPKGMLEIKEAKLLSKILKAELELCRQHIRMEDVSLSRYGLRLRSFIYSTNIH